ncbi:EGF-like domain protein [Teladorsagia circumcincta]|uniref:EGF-like domain protein n=1 Tax=Teladorsagia circumcincta TaxID=45464 RepID=A0A2G9UVI3_TELCI|nr:EGF-like domain protein [Teladorsagia circumcincta]
MRGEANAVRVPMRQHTFRYRCTCAPGYRLGADGHSCRVDRDSEGTLFIALGHEVRTMPLFESRTSHEGYETAQSLGSHGVVRSIDFVWNRQLIYLAISNSDHKGEVAVSVGGLLRVIRENIVGGLVSAHKTAFSVEGLSKGNKLMPTTPAEDNTTTAKCLCPDGYLTLPDGDCGPIRDSVVRGDQEKTDSEEGKTVLLDISHVGVAWMKERCEAGSGCLNGGECQDVKNEHGRVIKIVCNCVSPYEGDRCERTNPFEEYANQISPSSRPLWFTLLLTIVFILFIVAAFLLSYRYIEQIRNLPRKGSGVLRKEFSNPLFNDDRSSTGSSAEEQPPNELAYSNPLFTEENTHAAPFSGIQVTYTNKFVP